MVHSYHRGLNAAFAIWPTSAARKGSRGSLCTRAHRLLSLEFYRFGLMLPVVAREQALLYKPSSAWSTKNPNARCCLTA